MSPKFLRASLRLWRWRRNRWHSALPANTGPAHKRLQARVDHANRIIARRKSQLAHSKPPKRTPDGWMPGVPRHYASSGTPWQVDCPPKGLLHTTEGHGDATTTLDAKRAWPHFEVMEDGGIIQYFPVTIGARALVHNGPPTNGAHCGQIEVGGLAAHIGEMPAVQKAALRRVMRFIEAEMGVERACHVKFEPYPNPVGDKQRLSAEKWLKLTGWCGHQHAPGNTHEDPGAAPIKELLA